MVTRDAPTVLEYNCRVETLENTDRGGKKENMIFGMGSGDFIFGGNGCDKVVVGEWR